MAGRLARLLQAAALVAVAGCSSGSSSTESQAGTTSPPTAAPPGAPLVELAALDDDANDWIDHTLAGMDDPTLAAQLIIPWIPGAYAATTSPEFEALADWVEKGIGGVSISIGLPHSYADKLNQLQRLADVPLLVTSDFENGGPGMRINHTYAIPSLLPQGGGTSFSPTMSFGAIDDVDAAFQYGRITGQEARAVGVHVVFAPVLDVNSNPLNPVINTRSLARTLRRSPGSEHRSSGGCGPEGHCPRPSTSRATATRTSTRTSRCP